jgi:hypothetical protein
MTDETPLKVSHHSRRKAGELLVDLIEVFKLNDLYLCSRPHVVTVERGVKYLLGHQTISQYIVETVLQVSEMRELKLTKHLNFQMTEACVQVLLTMNLSLFLQHHETILRSQKLQ